MQNNHSKLFIAIALLGTMLFASCAKTDVQADENDEEIITTMQLAFTPVGGGAVSTFKFDDPDGPGGANPTQEVIQLAPNKTYNVAVTLLNKTQNPVGNITDEVRMESIAHRFYFEPSATSNITVSNLDNDTNGVALGINSTWTTGAVGSGNIAVTLRHYPGNPPNKAAGDLVTSQKSGSDIAVTFATALN